MEHIHESPNRKRVLVLGLDGATFDIIKPMVARGELPHLGRLLEAGTHGILKSTLPPITPTAWTSFYTGKNPGKHGIFDFEQAAEGSYELKPVPANQHGHKSLWRILSDYGKRVVVIDVPFTYPPEPVNGYMITGYGTPTAGEASFTYPPSLEAEIAQACGECRPAIPESLPNLTPDFFKEWDDLLENRDRINDYLLQSFDWDFYMIVFGVTDNVQHVLWNYLEPYHPDYYSGEGEEFRARLFHYYRRVDESIGRMLAHVDDDTYVITMSDHGFGSTRPGLFLPKFLMDRGYLHYHQSVVSGLGEWGMRRLLSLYHGVPWLRTMINRMRTQNKERLRGVLTKANLLPSPDKIDWAKTRVFPTSFGVNLFVNRAGRFPQGTVKTEAEYQALLDQLTHDLLELKDPEAGTRVAKAVHRKEALYQGEFCHLGPDLVVEWNNLYNPDSGENRHARVPGIVGSHVPEGVFIADGPGIRRGHHLDADITDIAPTILHLMGLPVPEDMDGRVLLDIFTENYAGEHPVVYGPPAVLEDMPSYGYSADEEAQVREQLRALGYIE